MIKLFVAIELHSKNHHHHHHISLFHLEEKLIVSIKYLFNLVLTNFYTWHQIKHPFPVGIIFCLISIVYASQSSIVIVIFFYFVYWWQLYCVPQVAMVNFPVFIHSKSALFNNLFSSFTIIIVVFWLMIQKKDYARI